MHRRGLSRFSVRVFFVSPYRITSYRKFSVFQKVSCIEYFEWGGGREGGFIIIFHRKCFVSQYQEVCQGNTSMFQIISGAEILIG